MDLSSSSLSSHDQLLTIDAVQRTLARSRASIYRYANTDADLLNPPFDPQRLNPEVRNNDNDPLLFHPNEVARFARDVLGIKQVTVEVTLPEETVTHALLRDILAELTNIRQLLQSRNGSVD